MKKNSKNHRENLKKTLLELLKKDEDFRYEVMGLLGYKEIIDEIRQLRRDFNEFVKLSEERWKENEKRWEENNKKWEENQRVIRWLMVALQELKYAVGVGFEFYTAFVIKYILKQKGVEADVRTHVNLPVDGYKEVDVFCDEPLIVAETSLSLRSIEEAEKKIEKLELAAESAEKLTGKKVFMKFFSVEFATKEVLEFLHKKAQEKNIELIVGR
ncbi:hypothetical protein HRbin19_01440 [bacterium HR19]|nr:hypothetical protein HRbin19_01440 [bacterium HR19]